MASALFTPEQVEIILGNPITKIVDKYRDCLPKDSFDQDIDDDVMLRFVDLFIELQGTEQAQIRLTDSPDRLKARLLVLAAALSNPATFPTALRPHCSSLLEQIVSPNASDLDFWTTLASFLIAFNSPSVSTTSKPPTKYSSSNLKVNSLVLRTLRENWTSDYLPESLEVLQGIIQNNESKSDLELYYAKTLVFVQSSGMGKSRLADAFGKECPMVNFVLREEGTVGYPPADNEVLSFMRKKLSVQDQENIMKSPKKEKLSSKRISEEDKKKIKNSPSLGRSKSMEPSLKSEKEQETRDEIFLESMATTVWNHSVAVGLLQAINEWVEQQEFESLEKLAATRHEEMAPYKHTSGNKVDWHLRSTYRTDFCLSVVSRAEEIANELIQNQDWRHNFRDDRDSQVRCALESGNSLNVFEGEAKKLIANLERFPRKNNGPLLVMVFDEASSLLKRDDSNELDPGRYHALNRIISCLKEYPMWFFFLSTGSQVGTLLPAKDAERTGNFSNDGSARIALDGHSWERFPPFLGLQLDVEDRKRMLKLDSLMKELNKKMNEFAQPEHMAIFGRPLWFGYEAEEMNRLAKLKLVGGKQNTPFNPKDVNHVFAAFSFRLSLDVCLQNPKSYSLARTAVKSFMRVAISMNQETGVLDTITPSEPVVAKAAMENLCKNGNWSHSIRTLTEELLDKGLIDKGLKGELYSRLILTLARDCLQISVSRRQATFTVRQFLTALYDEDHHQSIQLIPQEILEARMNFNHFVPIGENLKPEDTPGLLHDLLRRSAALQLSHNQPTYDKLIPIYFGDPDAPFNVSYCGAILVQDKNKTEATTLRSMFKETFTDVNETIPENDDPKSSVRDGSYLTSGDMKYPVLLLLFDLGVVRTPNSTSASVQVSRTGRIKPDIWAIHSRGHDSTIFGCVKNMRCRDDCERFFISLEPERNAHYELCQRNKIFSKGTRNFRYSRFSDVLKSGAKRKQDGDEDGDTQMENA